MRYEQYDSLEDAKASVPYDILIHEEMLGHRLTSFIRWMDKDLDVFVQAYMGQTLQPSGLYSHDKMLVFLQGSGYLCTTDNSRAPRNQAGTFSVGAEREAVWALGIERRNWKVGPNGPAWVAWENPSGAVVRRIEGLGFGKEQLQAVALELGGR